MKINLFFISFILIIIKIVSDIIISFFNSSTSILSSLIRGLIDILIFLFAYFMYLLLSHHFLIKKSENHSPNLSLKLLIKYSLIIFFIFILISIFYPIYVPIYWAIHNITINFETHITFGLATIIYTISYGLFISLYLALFFLGIKNYIKIFYNNIIKEPILKILQINETPEKIILEISKNLKNILENSKKKEEIITRNFFVIVLIFIAIGIGLSFPFIHNFLTGKPIVISQRNLYSQSLIAIISYLFFLLILVIIPYLYLQHQKQNIIFYLTILKIKLQISKDTHNTSFIDELINFYNKNFLNYKHVITGIIPILINLSQKLPNIISQYIRL